MDIIETIKKAEGFRSKPYRDHLGNLTIGYGWNLDAGISRELADIALRYIALEGVYDTCKLAVENNIKIDLDVHIGDARACVLYEMCYQLGRDGLSKFKKMWQAVADGDFKRAASEIRNSKLAHQCYKRAERYARQMETGEYQEVE